MAVLPVGFGASGGYTIDRSLRFRSSASAYLNRTPASAGNRKTWTWSGWVKRGNLGVVSRIFSADDGSASTDQDYNSFFFNSSDQLQFGGNLTNFRITTAVYRDPSSWYHIVLVTDTTQATSANRFRLYVNGVEVTAFGTVNNPSQNTDLAVNATIGHYIGAITSGNYLDGYLTEINFIDGQALDPTDFGEYNDDTGVWQPKKYTGTYGTNGFYLNFSDNSSTTTLGEDGSGNGNDWTLNNISLTSGSTYDSMTDVPTLTSETAGNYAVMNPLSLVSGNSISNANLSVSGNGTTYHNAATIAVDSQKWYWEITVTSAPGNYYIGVGTNDSTQNVKSSAFVAYRHTGDKNITGTLTAYGSTYTTGDVIGTALDFDAGTVTFYKNNSSQGAITLPSSSLAWWPYIYNNGSYSANFGQRPFAYTPPTGFKALHTGNLPDSTIVDGSQYFDAVLWTGDGTGDKAITGVGFQPDFVWVKSRSDASSHRLSDVVRGSNGVLFSNLTNAEAVNSASGYINSFDSDGFSTVAGATNNNNYNNTSISYVAWNWKANGAGVSNTAGSITSTVSANTTSGFSIVTYTGTGSAATVGHGLGVAPSMVIVKSRQNKAQTESWLVYHKSNGATKYQFLNGTGAASTFNMWNNTEPTSSVFSVSTYSGVNYSTDTYVAYCFADVEGFSQAGRYVGNGSADGVFVYLGFRPAFVIVKQSSAAGENWEMWDRERGSYNINTPLLYSNLSNAETAGTAARFDVLSNGFKCRTTNAGVNASGATYIYIAFAENPFKNSLAR